MTDGSGVTLPVAAQRLGVAKGTIYDARWRARVGLPVCRIGKRVLVLEEDLRALLERGRERLDER